MAATVQMPKTKTTENTRAALEIQWRILWCSIRKVFRWLRNKKMKGIRQYGNARVPFYILRATFDFAKIR